MTRPVPYYFLQTEEWLEFWKLACGKGHNFKYYESSNIFTYVYEYPWLTNKWGQKFWYIPKGFVLKKQINSNDDWHDITQEFTELLSQITNDAIKAGVVFLKLDFDDYLTDILTLKNNQEIKAFLQENFKYQFNYQTKPIQYLTCSYLDFCNLLPVKKDIELDLLYAQTQDFWQNTSKQVRRYTKTIIREHELGNWTVSTDKTGDNFEDFYRIHIETAKRQNFITQPYKYLKAFFNQPFSRIIIIKDSQGDAQCVWLGLNINNTLTYLLGGNTQISLDNHLQYLLHLQALKICLSEQINFYDLGGHDSNAGYGQFKQKYSPTIRNFLGPVDIILRPLEYSLVNNFLKVSRIIKNLRA